MIDHGEEVASARRRLKELPKTSLVARRILVGRYIYFGASQLTINSMVFLTKHCGDIPVRIVFLSGEFSSYVTTSHDVKLVHLNFLAPA